ncbi:MAG: uroporphyrinogen-III synthase [Gammaproteobacteria bacterium]
MTVSLDGYKILVTRPGLQGENLCRLINDAGGEAIPFPVIRIVPSQQPGPGQFRQLLAGSSHIIFVSRNAVVFAAQLAGDLQASLQGKIVFAVGAGTLQELEERGVVDIRSPGPQSGSEAVLALDELEESQISGRHILIIRGNGGRELLRETLAARGAQVRYADVYQRIKPDVDQVIVDSLWQDTRPDVIVITSAQGLKNLLVMSGEANRENLSGKRLVVMSSRLKSLAENSGFTFPAMVAGEQTDQGLLQAIGQSVELMRNEC